MLVILEVADVTYLFSAMIQELSKLVTAYVPSNIHCDSRGAN
jgi:hypothetical protein